MVRKPRPEWCGKCHDATRLIGDPPSRCPDCHPSSVRARGEAGAGPTITDGLVSLDQVTERKLRWLWKGRLPLGHLVIIDGDPGAGKSTIVQDWAARASAGAPWPDGQLIRKPLSTLLLTAEEGISDTILPRFRIAGGDRSRLFVLSHIPTDDGPRLPSIPADLGYIEQIVAERKITIVILDVLSAFIGDQVDTKSDAKMRRALYHLFTLAQRRQIVVIALRHLKKDPNEKNALYRGGGSIGITGQARAVYLAAVDPAAANRRVLAATKASNAALPRSLAYQLVNDPETECAFVDWIGEDDRGVAELLNVDADQDEIDEQESTVGWLRDYLTTAGGSAPFPVIMADARRHGISKATLQRARRKAGVSYRRSGFQEGSVWLLDDYQEQLPFASIASPTECEAIEANDQSPAESAGSPEQEDHARRDTFSAA